MLFAALGAVLGMLGLNRLPMHHHPLFRSKVFERVTDDAFFISIESWDPRFDPSATGTAAGVAGRTKRRAPGVLNDPRTRSRGAAARTGHHPAGAPVEPPAGHRGRLRPAGRGGLRDSRGGESEAVLLLVARVVPVLPEPGPRRALLRADPVRVAGRMGDRAAADRRDGLRNAPRDGGAFPPVAPRPARPLLLVRPRRSRARCAAALEGAVPQRAVLPDPGGALLRMLVLHCPALLPRLARPGRDRRSRRCRPACAASPGPPSSSSR